MHSVPTEDETSSVAAVEANGLYDPTDDGGGGERLCREEKYSIIEFDVDERVGRWGLDSVERDQAERSRGLYKVPETQFRKVMCVGMCLPRPTCSVCGVCGVG